MRLHSNDIRHKVSQVTTSTKSIVSRSSSPQLKQRSYDVKPVTPINLANNPSADRHVRHLKQNIPNFTLSSFIETNKVDLCIPVPKQRSYSGKKPVLPSIFANTLCKFLGVNGVLDLLNALLGTSYNLDPPYDESRDPCGTKYKLVTVLETYIKKGTDFGTAYAQLRRYWLDAVTLKHDLHAHKREDQERRENVVVDKRIKGGETPPRRVWDLYANRVVPFWIAREYSWGISHAWVDEKDRVDVWTPINNCEWPVPIPKDADLDLIRTEMLNLGAEYAWLDVLCLRQAGGRRENLRMEEWQVDVPTIGAVYRDVPVVCYFSGLGLPLHLEPSDFESDRSWFNRAWTLQEIPEDMIIGGETEEDGIMGQAIQTRFQQQLESLQQMRRDDSSVFHILSQMQNRVSTRPVDKVAGLAYLLYSNYIPIYDGQQSEEDAWTALVNVVQDRSQAQLLFFYPKPGDGNKCWRPSWKQIMTEILPSHGGIRWSGHGVRGLKDTYDADSYYGPRIDVGYVRGLENEPNEGRRRWGELLVTDNTGETHRLKIIADHTYPIPDDSYTLIGSCRRSDPFWVVGHKRQDGKFQKLSVISIADANERRRLRVAERYVETMLC
ncbi:hypothetical protein EDD18DRAFT_693673 [Armillaria luteobubalina]|uniref:Heterokaryon incompatibility domain-containing protein n=1 Tax=Armillaria luteobubalina TaxID=153913 RepID=A0AA39UTD7_9AGAR|nr:hypothetical protein EDD18DRAFT_693673 [Armillaria luteobubalina]